MSVTDDQPWRLVRLPVYPDLTEEQVTSVIDRTLLALQRAQASAPVS
jgi:dTDP-4-amino-4,6-dideoxygalactose transaminase